MIVYADTSALMKLVRVEAESDDLRRWLAVRAPEVVTSAIGGVELRRAAARVGPEHVAVADAVLDAVHVMAVTDSVLTLAGRLRPPHLRSLDAMHLATVALIADVDVVLCYDDRLRAAVERLGLAVESPGTDGPGGERPGGTAPAGAGPGGVGSIPR